MEKGLLTFFCGKMGAGKSTRAGELAEKANAVLLSEDEWLQSLYPQKIDSLESYVRYSSFLKLPMKKLVQSILSAGTDVVMDFPANTISQRAWFREIISESESPHRLIYIDLPDEVCLEQIKKRCLEQPHRSATDTQDMFAQVTKYFVEPGSEEGFNIARVTKTY
ncbi:cell division protein ZipA [Chromatiales bacterium (ex Bugula neritina AB1)]|nr:cell division protein ZipA [Chromatiales bacterium (ex Bugula neritina AB1)]